MGIRRSEKKTARRAILDRDQLIGCDVEYNGKFYINLTDISQSRSITADMDGRVIPEYIFTFENGDTFSLLDRVRRNAYEPDPNVEITFYFDDDSVNEPEQSTTAQQLGGRRKRKSNRRKSNKRKSNKRRSQKRRGSRRK